MEPEPPHRQQRRAPGATRLAPVPPGGRIEVIDVLRGLAIFGIFVVNLRLFAEPPYQQFLGDTVWTTPADLAASALIAFLAEGKFYTMFSFLFGLGAAMQLERSRARGASFSSLFGRRMILLLIMGLAHIFLLWWGDILAAYALLGLVLLSCYRQEVATLLKWAGALLLVPVILYGVSYAGVIAALSSSQEEGLRQALAAQEAYMAGQVAASYAAYGSSDPGAILAQRLHDTLFFWQGGAPIMLPVVFALFLVGFVVGRRRVVYDLPAHQELIRRVWRWGLAVGVPGNLIYTLTRGSISALLPSAAGLMGLATHVLGAPALCLAYMAGIVMLWEDPVWRRRLRPLAPVGRMALTNYLAQSLMATTIFYGYGLGLYGQLGPAPGLILVVSLFALQVVWSRWWLQRFRYGPLEWLWRSLTYRQVQPFRRRPGSGG